MSRFSTASGVGVPHDERIRNMEEQVKELRLHVNLANDTISDLHGLISALQIINFDFSGQELTGHAAELRNATVGIGNAMQRILGEMK